MANMFFTINTVFGGRKYYFLNYYLKPLDNKRTQRSTEIPRGSSTSADVSINSIILPQTTKQSNRLNNELK